MPNRTISHILSWLALCKRPTKTEIPPSLEEGIHECRAKAIKDELKKTLALATDKELVLKECERQAIQNNWPNDELEKLRIYAAYYCGNTIYAYTQILLHQFQTDDSDMFVMACIALYVNDRFEDAAKLLKEQDVTQDKFLEHQEFLGFAGYIMAAAGEDFSEAIRYFDAALDRGQMFRVLAINAYPMYFEAGQVQKSDTLRRVIHEKFPNDPEALYAIGCIELAKDYYPEGFRLCEARYFHPEVSRYINPKLLEKPRWTSGSITGKKILVHAEQGFGDNIMCARYLPLLKNAGATVILECQEAATSLISANFPDIEIIPIHQKRADTHSFDCWVGAMSLPHLFNSTAETIPGKTSYLRAPDEHLDHWRSRLDNILQDSQLKIGLAWSGNPAHRNDRRRSIHFELFSSYFEKLDTFNLFALQTEVPKNNSALIDLSEELVTLADTAALIEQMDLVITVDTSIVHLAGALGKRTWLLLPYRYEWRWGLEGPANAWYDSVRVFRQTSNGNWKDLLDNIFLKELPRTTKTLRDTPHALH